MCVNFAFMRGSAASSFSVVVVPSVVVPSGMSDTQILLSLFSLAVYLRIILVGNQLEAQFLL